MSFSLVKLRSWVVPLDLLSVFDASPNLSFEAPNLDTIDGSTNSKHIVMLNLGQAKELAIEGTFHTPFNFMLVSVTSTRMDPTHVASQGLTTLKIFVALKAVIL